MQHIGAWDFRLAFVGMSNCWKSYISKILQNDAGFFWYEVDKEIQKKMWFNTMEDISSWMWKPGDKGFEEREALYLEKEEECTYFRELDIYGKNLVFDTTGSVVYLSDTTRSWLKNHCLVVHIDVWIDAIPIMLERFMSEAKPVFWNGMLNNKQWETEKESLRRCYPELLKDRLKKYKDFSHITIPASEMKDLSAEQTIEKICEYLP